jgi:hypothetical protein
MSTRSYAALMAIVIGSLMTAGLVAQTGTATTSSSTSATEPLFKFTTDFDVPESPGFATLGVTPSKILRGCIAKPVVTSLLGQITGGGKLKGVVAIDVAPYFLYGGKVNNVDAYRANPIRRAFANTQLSFASVQDQNDTASILFGLGLRMVFLDAHDVLMHRGVLERVDAALIACSRAQVVTANEASAPGSGIGKNTRVPALPTRCNLPRTRHFCTPDGRWPRARDSVAFCTAPSCRATASATVADGSGYRVAIHGVVIRKSS